MKDGHGPDVCLGRGAVPELADPLVAVLRDEFEREGFVVSVDVPFAADRPTTLTSTAQLAGTPAVQIELARRTRTRTPAGQGDGRAVSALARAALRIAGFAPDRG